MNAMSMGANARAQLRAIVERVERLEEEKKAIGDDIKDMLAEAKTNGFDLKAIRTCLKERKQDKHEREEQEAITDVYRLVLGLIRDTGEAIAKTPAPSEPPAPSAEPPRADTSNPPFAAPERPLRADEIEEGGAAADDKVGEMPPIPEQFRRTKDS